MPRFVLLYHDCPPGYERPSHWDLMLEDGDVLKTWALAELPQKWQTLNARTLKLFPQCAALATANEVAAEELADHRLAYLTLEGPLTGERGNVTRIASGTYEVTLEAPDHLIVNSNAESSLGTAELRRETIQSIKWRLSVQPPEN